MHLIKMKLDHADAIARYGGKIALLGIIATYVQLQLPLERQYALISTLMVINLGIHAGVLRKWRTEPGLWMLAGLTASVSGFAYLAFAGPHYLALLTEPPRPAPPANQPFDIYRFRWTVDGPFSLLFLWLTFRVTTTLGVWNWRMSGLLRKEFKQKGDHQP